MGCFKCKFSYSFEVKEYSFYSKLFKAKNFCPDKQID